MRFEKLFSYGTLQHEAVQLANFGRKLQGMQDTLWQFGLSTIKIKDSSVVETSGEAVHPIISFTGNSEDKVEGVVFEITQEELMNADAYEVPEYKRIQVKLASGTLAWAYVSLDTHFLV